MLGAHSNNVKVRLHRAHQALRALVVNAFAAGDLAGRYMQPQLSR